MAKQVYTTEDIEFLDGTEITLKPLPVLKLRKFMVELDRLDEVTNFDENLTVLIDLTKICINHYEAVKAKLEENTEWYEETMDLQSMFKVIEICGGVKLNDPKLMELAQQMQAQQAVSAGTN